MNRSILFLLSSLIVSACGTDLPDGYAWVSVGNKSGAFELPVLEAGKRIDVRKWLGLPTGSTTPTACDLSNNFNEIAVWIPEDSGFTGYTGIQHRINTNTADTLAATTALNNDLDATIPVKVGNARFMVYAGLYYSGTCLNSYTYGTSLASSPAKPIYGETSLFNVTEGSSQTVTLIGHISSFNYFFSLSPISTPSGLFAQFEINGGDATQCPFRGTIDNSVQVFDELSSQWMGVATLSGIENGTSVYVGPIIPRRTYTIRLQCNSDGGTIVGRDDEYNFIEPQPGETVLLDFNF